MHNEGWIMTQESYSGAVEAKDTGARGVLWNGIGLAGRQVVIVTSSLVLARLLGPESYGIITQAAVYTSFMSLLLDQGISAALISSAVLPRDVAGAAMTANLILSLALAFGTLGLSGLVADFFAMPELSSVLTVLGFGLVLKAVALVPRVILTRSMNFRPQAGADLAGAVGGALLAVLTALLGLDYWALVVQIVASDAIVAIVMLVFARPPLPNVKLDKLLGTVGFSFRVFGSNFISYSVQNVDKLFIGKFSGAAALAQYGLAFRVLTTPVQMIGQVVTRVLYPVVARKRAQGKSPVGAVSRSVRGIALVSFPAMTGIAVSAWEVVPLVLGNAWAPAVPVLCVLAVSGARQSVTTVNTSVLLGMDRSSWLLRFSIVAALVQICSIIVGFQFGITGVAFGVTIAGFLLTPIICWMQKRCIGFSYRSQFKSIAAPLHGSIWVAGSYFIVSSVLHSPWLVVGAGMPLCVLVYIAVIVVFHREVIAGIRTDVRSMVTKK